MPFTRSPCLVEYSFWTASHSASRTFWKMTCLAVCAAMRPNSSISISEPISSPISASLSYTRASFKEISALGLLTDSTMVFFETTEISPVLESISTWMFSACPNRFLAAVCKAASMAPMTLVLSMPFCRPISSMTEINSRFIIGSPLRLRCSPGHHPLGLGNHLMFHGHGPRRRRLVHLQRHRILRHVGQCSHQAPLIGKRLSELQRHAPPDCPAIVLNPLEGTIETRRGNFQR